ncbi:PaaI family thioesterase [Selenomonadales bacterium OttesenSCG-928-I06]|nr:PaaI family thioesterase [Selenomonadales bacterium OttesenSCG-928-I06]
MEELKKTMPNWLQEEVYRLYESNIYAQYLGMKIVNLKPSEAVVSMKARKNLMNMLGVLHGGAITSLTDMVMSLACATVGKRIVTLGMNINLIYAADLDSNVLALARVIHLGKTTLVVECRVVDSATHRLLAKGRGTFFITSDVKRQSDESSDKA